MFFFALRHTSSSSQINGNTLIDGNNNEVRGRSKQNVINDSQQQQKQLNKKMNKNYSEMKFSSCEKLNVEYADNTRKQPHLRGVSVDSGRT